jgi:hypothetical protein
MAKTPPEQVREMVKAVKGALGFVSNEEAVRNPTLLPDLERPTKPSHPVFVWLIGGGGTALGELV